MIKRVPVQLVKFSISHRKTKELRLLLFLKLKAKDGVTKNYRAEVDFFCSELEISTRTFSRHLENLEELKLVNIDDHGTLFLRSWKRIEELINLKFTSSAEFHSDYLHKNVFKGYLMGILIGYQCKLKKYLSLKERKNRRSIPNQGIAIPISISYLSKQLNVSNATVAEYKKESIKHGFITRIKHTESISLEPHNYDIAELRKNWAENSFASINKNGLKIIHPDCFIPQLHFRRFN